MRTMNLSWVKLTICLLISITTVHAADSDNPLKPDIVFFLIDDLGYADCGFNGGTEIKTPRIDELAYSGAVLEAHYVQPVCSPTRAALMTGRYPNRTGVYTVVRPHAKWGLPLNERTLAMALKEAGYSTAIVGKWHLGEFESAYLPLSRGFEHQHGLFFGMIDHFTHMRGNSHDWHHDDKPFKEEGYATHLITREACRLIESQPKSKPLFLYVPFNAVHAPLQVPDKYLDPYRQLQGGRQILAGMLSAVDEGIGQIIETLDKSGRRDNTLIVFSSDNGGPRPGTNTPLRDFKGSIYEGGTRGCAFATWPGRIPARRRIKDPVHVIDWYPTLITLAGGNLDQKFAIDGKDLWPLLTKNAASPHEAIYSIQSPSRAAVRIGDWKLISNSVQESNAPPGPVRGKKKANAAMPNLELYNLAMDISESVNLASDEPTRVQAMKARLTEFLKDAAPVRNADDDASE